MKALLALLVVASVGVASVAAADAIPPPPENCPAGSTPVSSHSGAGCKLNPPTNCPSGWRGMLGGVCGLSACKQDAQCTGGRVCREASLCMEKHEVHHPRMAETFTEWRAYNVCAAGVTCESPRSCRSQRVCVEAEIGQAVPLLGGPDALRPREQGATMSSHRGGCGAGCAIGVARGMPFGLGAFVLLALWRRTSDSRACR